MQVLERFRSAILVAVAVGAVAILTIGAFGGGPIMASDTPSFTSMAGVFVASGFDFGAVLDAKSTSHNPTPLYAVSMLVFAAVMSLPAWEFVFVGVNVLLIAGGLLLMWQMLGTIGASVLTICICTALLLISDAMVWVRYVLSDPLYFSVVMLTAWAAWRFAEARRNWVWLVPVLVIALFTRPASPGLLAGVALGLALLAIRADTWRRGTVLVALLVVLLFAAGVFAGGLLLVEGTESQHLAFIRRMAVEGQVIYSRPDTWLAGSESPAAFVALFLTRFAAFFTVWVSSFSLPHNLATVLVVGTFLASVVLTAIESPTPAASYRLRLLLGAVIFGGAVYTSATLLDFDWRYRFPYLGPMIAFTGITFEHWVRRLLPGYALSQ